MSRIGKKPIEIPAGVTIAVNGSVVTVKGPRGELTRELRREFMIDVKDNIVTIVPRFQSTKTANLWGLTRSLLANMVAGVFSGFEKILEFEGVGYRAALEGTALVMQLGFSHPVKFPAPPGATFGVQKNTINISGIDKEVVGETAARVRALKPPEPYKGKGIRYKGEVVRRKAGKKATGSGG